ncbi:DUF2190 family protein [uncultured Oscillibacter sp.]|jgi:predicted RecA/RadA family phage recombinase|uniref:DUF2190 family protein n=1 Tax=uncultured Oscillibacter sp. TaxID=876091 RepID=UPI00272D0DF1|nr:DUF2190 family protein [uncultured Oscillibacter sp.]
MTKAEYLQRGESLDYTNVTEDTIPDGAVVTIGSRIGVTGCPIPPGKTGSLHVVGVFEIAKSGTAAVEMGQAVYFDGTGITDAANDGAESNPKANVAAGYAAAPAAAGDDTILVQING